MKKLLLSLCLVGLMTQGAMAAGIYENTTQPSTLSLQGRSSCKVGTATCKSYFGIVNLGDCSYQKAMQNGKITQVHHHDTQTKGWFFLKRKTTKVYGE